MLLTSFHTDVFLIYEVTAFFVLVPLGTFVFLRIIIRNVAGLDLHQRNLSTGPVGKDISKLLQYD